MTHKILFIFLIYSTKVIAADDICFSMNIVDAINEQNCNPVKVNIQYTDCKTGQNGEVLNGVMARFECKKKVKQLKYWHNNAMLFANLAKKDDVFIVSKTYAIDYGRKDAQAAVVSPPSSVVAIPVAIPKAPKADDDALNAPIELAAEAKLDNLTPSVEPTVSATPAPAPSPVPVPVVASQPAEKKEFLSDIKIKGLIDFYYLYNLNLNSAFVTTSTSAPAPTTNVIYLPNTYHDQFTLNMAVVGFKKEAQPWGFDIDLGFGPAADHMAGAHTDNSLRAVNQAVIIYKTALDLVIKAGRFHSFLGTESHFASHNTNYTKSYGVTYLTPSILDGIELHMPFGNLLDISLFVTNGWDISYEDNRSKVFGAKIKYRPIEEIELVATAQSGNENVTGTDALTNIFEGAVIWKPAKEFKFAVDFTGGQSSVSGNNARMASSFAGYGWWNFLDQLSLAIRYEMYNDDALFPWGLATQTYVTSQNQTINATTATLEFAADKNLKFKAEYRIDTTNAATPAFKDSSNNPINTQSLAIGSALVSF